MCCMKDRCIVMAIHLHINNMLVQYNSAGVLLNMDAIPKGTLFIF